MDLKNLPNALEAIRKPVGGSLDIYALNERAGVFIESEAEKLQKSVALPAWASPPKDLFGLADIEAQKALALGTLGLPGLTDSDPQVLAEQLLIQTEKALGLREIENPTDARKYGAIDWEENRRKDAEHRNQELLDQSVTNMQHIARQAAEARERENAKLEYARRSAEASEENLAAANQRAAAAEAGQARAEKRETRMFWITVVITAIGAGASIWALLK